ncbi:hypothetical protein [Thalassoroseus pseudoceratinae]|uniref:hypothetical protein n=1 Tax=Thalassoroseus pseudoceratinae TaxID=2713176 RepID=UPI00141E296D|nr:hypothetical protein [Thalassoroseus pseudoceratinae]
MTDSSESKSLPITSGGSVPVFDCRVFVSHEGANGPVVARCVNLPEVKASGPSERDVLRKIVDAFKSIAQDYHSRGEPIPFIETDAKPGPDEQERWIPVHL